MRQAPLPHLETNCPAGFIKDGKICQFQLFGDEVVLNIVSSSSLLNMHQFHVLVCLYYSISDDKYLSLI